MKSVRTTAGVVLGMLAAHPAVLHLWPGPLRMLIVTAVLGWLPGVAWRWCWRSHSRAWGVTLARDLVAAALVLIVAALALRLVAVPLAAASLWFSLCAFTAMGVILPFVLPSGRVTRVPATRAVRGAAAALAVVMFAGSLVVFERMAVAVVPPMVDHDLDLQGPGYALLTSLTPRVINDRGLLYYFAHPPLLHVYGAASIVLQGGVESLRAYDTITSAATGRDDAAALAAAYEHYARTPLIAETRSPNVVLAALSVAMIAVITVRRSRRVWLGALMALAYAANPEVLVRSSYGGYFAISTCAALLMLVHADHIRRLRGITWAAAWGALANHKLVLLPAALLAGARLTAGTWMRAWHRTGGIVLAFAAGSAAFWIWGLLVNPGDFLADHVQHHLMDRITHDNPLGYEGYLSHLGLWREFGGHTGYLLLPVAILCACHDLRHACVPRDHTFTALLLSWTLVTAVVFTFVDWRMTKHISPLLVSLPLLLTPPRHAPRWRIAAAVITCVWSLAWYAGDIGVLLTNFEEFGVTPDW
ncbi:MAG: hypothetical protein AMXMBFR57_07880 [Acidimicrobiia bacterium]